MAEDILRGKRDELIARIAKLKDIFKTRIASLTELTIMSKLTKSSGIGDLRSQIAADSVLELSEHYMPVVTELFSNILKLEEAASSARTTDDLTSIVAQLDEIRRMHAILHEKSNVALSKLKQKTAEIAALN